MLFGIFVALIGVIVAIGLTHGQQRRQAEAMERIADALEGIQDYLDAEGVAVAVRDPFGAEVDDSIRF